MCAGLNAGIESATHAVGKRRIVRVRERRRATEEEGTEKGKVENGGVAGLLNNLTIETGGTEEEVAEGLEAALEMEVVGDGEDDGEGEGEEESDGTLRALGALDFLT